MSVGIEALNVYCGIAYVSVRDLFASRGLAASRYRNLMMERRSIAMPFEDPVTHGVNAAAPIVRACSEAERERIEILITSSESGVDYSKSIASYVHGHLDLSSRCRLLEVKQACYGATAALQLAIGYVASNVSPGAKVLVIATDVSLVDEDAAYAEPTMGTGAAAMLISDVPDVVAFDLGAFGTHSYETMDSARPTPSFDVVDVDRSLFAYLDCLTSSFDNYASRVAGSDFCTTFRYLAFHTPFAGLVKSAHRKMLRDRGASGPALIEEDFRRRVEPSLIYPRVVGNLCSGSVYLALISAIEHADLNGPARIGLFSYGSGCASEFFSGVIDGRSREKMAEMRIPAHLEGRCELRFDEYTRLLEATKGCLVPVRKRKVALEDCGEFLERVKDRPQLLALHEIDDYHRRYEWI